jgi:uncharacterized protein (DUF2141 family)
VRVVIQRGKRVVAASLARRAPATGALTLRLDHPLPPGRYTVKVIAERDGRRMVAHAALRRHRPA